MSITEITLRLPAPVADAAEVCAQRRVMPLDQYLSRAVMRVIIEEELHFHEAWVMRILADWDHRATLDDIERRIGADIDSGIVRGAGDFRERAEALFAAVHSADRM